MMDPTEGPLQSQESNDSDGSTNGKNAGTPLTATHPSPFEIEHVISNNHHHPVWSSSPPVVWPLCCCMFTYSYLVISVFSYAGYLTVDLLPTTADPNTGGGVWAGLVGTSFMLGRAATAIVWVRVADSCGRRPVLVVSLVLSTVLSILFGLAQTYAGVLMLRFAMGCGNGILPTIKTIVSDWAAAGGDEKTEAQNMGRVIGMWAFGFLVSPALSGFLAEPLQQYPTLRQSLCSEKCSWLGQVLEKYPFLLPNVLGALLCLLSLAVVVGWVPETLPFRHQGEKSLFLCFHRTPSSTSYTPVSTKDESSRAESVLQNDGHESDHSEDGASGHVTMADLWSRRHLRHILLLDWLACFVELLMDEGFPLFCMSPLAGFGMAEKQIGQLLSLCGLVYVVCQLFVYDALYGRVGLDGSVRWSSALSGPVLLLVPLSLIMNDGTLSWTTFVFLGFISAMYRVFSFCFFSSISVLANRAVPSSQRATMNGLSGLGASVVKGLGPACAGWLVSTSVTWLGSVASVLIFGVLGGLGILVTVTSFVICSEQNQEQSGETNC